MAQIELRQDDSATQIELPESWAAVAEPLRALIAEIERDAQAAPTMPTDLARCRRAGRPSKTRSARSCAHGSRRRRRGHRSHSSSLWPIAALVVLTASNARARLASSQEMFTRDAAGGLPVV